MKKYLILSVSILLLICFTISAVADEFAPTFGIDVSVFQGDVDWGKVANTDTEFAILRIGYNDKQDAQFSNNYKNAKAAGIPVGAYMYSYAVTEEAAIEEANIVLERIKGMQFEYPIYLDVEDKKLLKEEYNLTKEQRTKNALAFVRTMQANGYYVGVYSNLEWFTNYLDVKTIGAECETWIAHYNESYDYSNTSYGMWQYTNKGVIDGITANKVDLNICYKDYPSIIKNGGYNGFEKSAFSPTFGIDVSVFQGDVDWGKVANTDTEFAILRIGYNDKQDAQFLNNYKNAKAAGIPVGAYMYSYAVTEEAAIEEANIVLERIKGMQFEYPIYLDVEDKKLLKEEYNLTKEQRTKNALAFVRTMQANGYYVGVYSNLNWFTNYLDVDAIQAECETWIAHYTDNTNYENTNYGMWQYTDKGVIDGITANKVDLNICYKDYPSIIKNGGYNGFEKTADNLLEPTGVKGDIDANGVCNLLDLVLLARYVAGWDNLLYVQSELNVNEDSKGTIDLTDVTYLAQRLAGW